jgi:glycosyltransferase involved in cell wall biosynthesis
MVSSERYVCAFRGRRDNYQVPLALHEVGKLEAFITDAYTSDWIDRFSKFLPQSPVVEKLRFRRDGRLPDERIHSLWATTAREHLRHLFGSFGSENYAIFDCEYSRAAARLARNARANLFLYSPYAWEAFSERYSYNLKKILFQFHPHVSEETRILKEDAAAFSNVILLNQTQFGSIHASESEARARSDDSWKLADHIVCASTFAYSTLISVGADPVKVSVIPYGIDRPAEGYRRKRDDGFHVVFVGSGIQRKGLHHLLLAWQRARLPAESKLTLVCRVLDPAFAPMIAATRRVKSMKRIDRAQLENLLGSATLFVMPSLMEGFGQVYLEALSFGLPVLGTRNTGISDLGTEADGVYQVEPGNIDELTSTLERLSKILPGVSEMAERARLCASRFTWERFRSKIYALV